MDRWIHAYIHSDTHTPPSCCHIYRYIYIYIDLYIYMYIFMYMRVHVQGLGGWRYRLTIQRWEGGESAQWLRAKLCHHNNQRQNQNGQSGNQSFNKSIAFGFYWRCQGWSDHLTFKLSIVLFYDYTYVLSAEISSYSFTKIFLQA